MAAPATEVRDPLEQARAAAAALSEARLELSDKIIEANSRVRGARDRRATRATAEALVDRIIWRLAGTAENFGAGLVVATGARAEGQVWATLTSTPGICFWAAFEPDRVKKWMLDALDREAALYGGWSTLTETEAAERLRQAETELAGLMAEERKLLRAAAAAGISLERFGDTQPGVRTADDTWRAGHTVTEHRR